MLNRHALMGLLPLALIMLLGAFLRLYGLGNESAWSDEFCSLVQDPTMTIREFFAVHRYRNPDHFPFFYFLVYLWSTYVSASDYGIRLFSVLFSLLSIPMIYLCGRAVGGRQSGLLAAFLFSVSPYYIYHAQGPRPYAFVILMALVAIWSLMRAPHTNGRGWWILNFLANMLMIHAHLSGAFFLAAQGCFLLLVYRHRILPVAIWSMAQLVGIVSPVLWMMVPPQDPMYYMPELWSTLINWFGDDIAHWNIELIFGNPDWASTYPQLWSWSVATRPYFGVGMIFFFATLSASACLIATIRLVRHPDRAGDTCRKAEALLFFAFVALVPPAILIVVSYIKEPMPMPRYAVYSNLGLYCMAGWLLSCLSWRPARWLLVLTVFVLYGYQAMVTFQATARTQWNQLVSWIESEQSPEDIAIVGSYGDAWFDIDINIEMIMRHALGDNQLPVFYSRTLETMVEDSRIAAQALASSSDASVWLVVFMFYDKRAMPELEQRLRDEGLSFERRDFLAMEGLSAFRLYHDPSMPIASNMAELPHLNAVLADKVLADWGITIKDPQELEASRAALRLVFDGPPPAPMGAMSIAYLSMLAGAEDSNMALQLADKAVDADPKLATAHFARGIALLQNDYVEEASEAFEACLAAPKDEISDLIKPLLEALIDRDFDRAAILTQRIKNLGAPVSAGLAQVLGVEKNLESFVSEKGAS